MYLLYSIFWLILCPVLGGGIPTKPFGQPLYVSPWFFLYILFTSVLLSFVSLRFNIAFSCLIVYILLPTDLESESPNWDASQGPQKLYGREKRAIDSAPSLGGMPFPQLQAL